LYFDTNLHVCSPQLLPLLNILLLLLGHPERDLDTDMIIFKELSLFRSHARELAKEVIARSRQILSGMIGLPFGK